MRVGVPFRPVQRGAGEMDGAGRAENAVAPGVPSALGRRAALDALAGHQVRPARAGPVGGPQAGQQLHDPLDGLVLAVHPHPRPPGQGEQGERARDTVGEAEVDVFGEPVVKAFGDPPGGQPGTVPCEVLGGGDGHEGGEHLGQGRPRRLALRPPVRRPVTGQQIAADPGGAAEDVVAAPRSGRLSGGGPLQVGPGTGAGLIDDVPVQSGEHRGVAAGADGRRVSGVREGHHAAEQRLGGQPDAGGEPGGEMAVGPLARFGVLGGQLGVEQGDSGVPVGEPQGVPHRLGVARVAHQVVRRARDAGHPLRVGQPVGDLRDDPGRGLPVDGPGHPPGGCRVSGFRRG
ncbi:hypothetical protein SGRI78S_06257 [Streptomyces griseus subsp. griseus]